VTYRVAADRLIGAALGSDHAFLRLSELCDGIGHRLSGSRALERAVEWAAAAMREELSQVMKEEGRRALWLSIAAGVPIGVATSILASYMWGVFAGR